MKAIQRFLKTREKKDKRTVTFDNIAHTITKE